MDHWNFDVNEIKWETKTNDVLFNPRIPFHEKKLLEQALSNLEAMGTFVFGTSGSTGSIKWVVLSKEAVLTSAKAVNVHLHSSSSDRWLNPLPPFHVGGMGIYARAYLSGAQVIEISQPKWNVETFITELEKSQATLTALVPAQVFDLVSSSHKAPRSLRAVIVGGGVLNEKLYLEAIAKGWRLLPSYGLTECASQVATAEIGSWEKNKYPPLKPLEHVQLELNSAERLKIKSKALLTGYLSLETHHFKLIDPKEGEWFTTEDFASFNDGKIVGIRREGSFLKIGGESVDMARLESIFEEIKLALAIPFDAALIAVPDSRLENAIHLAVDEGLSQQLTERVLEAFHGKVFPYERIRKIHVLPKIPRSELKKVLKNDLLNAIGIKNA